jgi:lipoprotein-anchoring transpeptidase ErfK/SrfK
MTINGIQDPRRLSIGRRIKIPKLDLSIMVDKTKNTLTLYNDDRFFKRYDARTGAYDYMTPNGEFTIQSKTEHPTWTDPKTGRRYPPEDPENQLGVRWMAFDEPRGLGIHEAVDPETVGTYSSNGCIGLRRADVIELYNLVGRGTPLKIVGQRPPDIKM